MTLAIIVYLMAWLYICIFDWNDPYEQFVWWLVALRNLAWPIWLVFLLFVIAWERVAFLYAKFRGEI